MTETIDRFPAPLDDLRVIEIGDEIGHHCGKLLADLGADVIRVEPPGGSPTRRVGPFYQDIPDPNRSLYFWHYNTNKRSITLDLDTPDGQAIARRLAQTADVILESRPPGYLPARGLGHADLAPANPGLISCSITPFGQSGPWADFAASDLILMALGGQMGVCGYEAIDDPDETPIAATGGQAWHVGGNLATSAILAALHARDRGEPGQAIDVSVHEAIALCTEGAFPDFYYGGANRRRQTGRHASVHPAPPTQSLCRDGRYVNCPIPQMSDAIWLRLVEWLDSVGLAEDLTDDRFLLPGTIQAEMPHIHAVIRRFCAAHTADEIFHGAQQRKLPWGTVRAPSELIDDPHFAARGFFVAVDHPELGASFTYPGAPYRFQRSPWRIRRRAPLLGEDNLAIYQQELGYSLAEIAALTELSVI